MNYPNAIKKSNKTTKIDSKLSHKNRGMTLEGDINVTNEYYREIDKAIIYKKPTPIKIVKVDYPSRDKTTIKELKKRNRQLYDSLEASKDKIDFLVQFTSKQEYNTGKVVIRKVKEHDTVYVDSLKFADSKTFEYTNVNQNDTMIYKLKINSKEEPNWYSLNIKTSTKYTIVNKELENGQNHITIGDGGHNADITDVTVFKKDKKTFWKRFSVGPSVTAGYDLTHKQWGIMAGASITYNLTK